MPPRKSPSPPYYRCIRHDEGSSSQGRRPFNCQTAPHRAVSAPLECGGLPQLSITRRKVRWSTVGVAALKSDEDQARARCPRRTPRITLTCGGSGTRQYRGVRAIAPGRQVPGGRTCFSSRCRTKSSQDGIAMIPVPRSVGGASGSCASVRRCVGVGCVGVGCVGVGSASGSASGLDRSDPDLGPISGVFRPWRQGRVDYVCQKPQLRRKQDRPRQEGRDDRGTTKWGW